MRALADSHPQAAADQAASEAICLVVRAWLDHRLSREEMVGRIDAALTAARRPAPPRGRRALDGRLSPDGFCFQHAEATGVAVAEP